MSKKHSAKSSKVDKKAAYLIIGLAAVLAVLLIVAMLPSGLLNFGAGDPTGDPQQTQLPPDKVYERWLASGMILAVSMEYPDFQDLEVYLASEVDLAQKSESKGVYVRFTSGAEQIVLYSNALEAERTKKGTRDLYTAQIGYASLDAVEADSVDLASMVRLALDDLSDQIEHSTRIAIYSH